MSVIRKMQDLYHHIHGSKKRGALYQFVASDMKWRYDEKKGLFKDLAHHFPLPAVRYFSIKHLGDGDWQVIVIDERGDVMALLDTGT
jgi:hypothetical protein